MALSKYDKQYLEAITPFLEPLQYFVDANICNGNSMTAAAICEGFTEASGQNFDSDIFIKGFRVAVREGKISGIVSAKRAGYKREGENSASINEVALEAFAPYIENVQAFVNKNLTDFMTSSVIYQKFSKESDCDLTEAQFRKGLSLAMKEDLIEGLLCLRGKGKGYILTSALEMKDKKAAEKAQEDSGESNQCIINISPGKRIIASDRYNWSYQALHGSTWVTEGYYPNVKSIMECLAKKVLDAQMKEMESFSIKEVCDKIEECTTRITEALENLLPETKKDEERAA